jgi:hypothetical protein
MVSPLQSSSSYGPAGITIAARIVTTIVPTEQEKLEAGLRFRYAKKSR